MVGYLLMTYHNQQYEVVPYNRLADMGVSDFSKLGTLKLDSLLLKNIIHGRFGVTPSTWWLFISNWLFCCSYWLFIWFVPIFQETVTRTTTSQVASGGLQGSRNRGSSPVARPNGAMALEKFVPSIINWSQWSTMSQQRVNIHNNQLYHRPFYQLRQLHP